MIRVHKLFLQLNGIETEQYLKQMDPNPCGLTVFDSEDQCSPVHTLSKVRLHPWRYSPRLKRSTIACKQWLWDKGVVPYVNQLIDQSLRQKFQNAVNELNGLNACVKFERLAYDDIIRFRAPYATVKEVKEAVCQATPGITGKRTIELSVNCTTGKLNIVRLKRSLSFKKD